MRDSVRAVINFHFKHHRHGFAMPHPDHAPRGVMNRMTGMRMHIGADTPSLPTLNEIYAKTDELFWNTTHYKVGQKLNPLIPADKAMIPTWLSLLNQVKHNVGIIPTPAGSSQAIADLHQVQADKATTVSVEAAKDAIKAASLGDTAKAAEATAVSNAAKAQADTHIEQVETHTNVATELAKVDTAKIKEVAATSGLPGLYYLAAKSWLSTPSHSQYWGWLIHKDGRVETKWTDSVSDINNWFGTLGTGNYADVLYGVYFDANGKKDASGVVQPVDEYRPPVTQAEVDFAINAAMGKHDSQVYASPGPQPKQAGAGGAIALMLVLGGGIAMAAASGSK